MPILNPRQAYNLLKYKSSQTNDIALLLISLLPIASEKYNSSFETEEIHNQFIDFIIKNIEYLIDYFDFSIDDLARFYNIHQDNGYNIFYNIIKSKSKFDKINDKGFEAINLDYIGCLNNIITAKVYKPRNVAHFFIPILTKNIGCYVSSNSSYAVLTFNSIINDDLDYTRIKLMAIMLAAAGYILVSCISDEGKCFDNFSDLLHQIIFSETHIFVENVKENTHFNPQNFSIPNIGFVYIYVHKVDKELYHHLHKYKNNFVKIFIFSKEIDSIKDNSEIESIFYEKNFIEKCPYFKPNSSSLSGFDKDVLSISLCNVPLYSSKKITRFYTPTQLSGFANGLISKKNFINVIGMIKFTFNEEKFYIDYSDIHLMNPELFITDPMYLSKQNFDIKIVEDINHSYKKKTTIMEKNKIKNSSINENITEKMHNAFHYLNKYTLIEPYTSQIYAVYEAISSLGSTEEGYNNIILQVYTGEGKSFIIQALAEYLARQGNIVHIATSNIILAARDFEKSYNYFVNCERKASKVSSRKLKGPAILLHEFELEHIKKFINNRKIVSQQEFDDFYSEKNFNNPCNMNISVCQENSKANIIYSTFLNFEAFYLNQHERNPSSVGSYMNKCYLLIDEADSILIDELTNGTILSKPMKSNAHEVLEFVYYFYTRGLNNPEKMFNMVKENFPECVDLSIDHINKMFSDIDKVKAEDFTDGNRYIITTNPRDKNMKIVVPFDSEHKGIAEYNKIFNGFIHQFVGIKETKVNRKNLELQPLSMNYLFISHPTYIKKYKGVCGVTGTVGSKNEKEILKKYYDITIKKVPRHQMNLRYDLPMIITDDVYTRNKRICHEINELHKLNYPVLVVFIDINEIKYIRLKLNEVYHIDEKEIKSFDGLNSDDDESIKNLLETYAGKPGAITLGTNFCGRGVSIECEDKPLFVIVSYYSQDNRSINQVLGRAGRNGSPGLSRIICTKDMYYRNENINDQKIMTSILKEFDVKNKYQLDYINDIRDKRPWIFDETEYTKMMTKEETGKLRESNININRITAYNFKFPLCMSIETFLKIQIQRIYSIKNCPECKFTWNLFRMYMRELVLEAWSLFIDSVDFDYEKMKSSNFVYKGKDYSKSENIYNDFFSDQYNAFIILLDKYVPNDSNLSIVETFFFIHDKVIENWENIIIENLPDSIRGKHIEKGKENSYTSFKMGFYPMSLAENSGARLTPLTPSQQKIADKGRLYIIDPELRYIKKGTDERFSITVLFDKIFEKFQEVVDDKLQGLFGIRFFLRRTLAGCEFGVCVDPMYEADKSNDFLNCLIDRNPIIMLTICTKSTVFWIGGILMIVLIFVTSICTLIALKVFDPSKLGTDIINLLKKVWKKFVQKDDSGDDNDILCPVAAILNPIFDSVITLLQKMIIKNLEKVDLGLSLIFETLLNIFVPLDTSKIDEKLSEKVFSHLKFNSKANEFMKGTSPFGKLIKIGILIIILIAIFIMNFKHRKQLNFENSTKKQADSYLKENKSNSLKDLSKFKTYKNAEHEVDAEIKEDFSENS